ncbi:MAG: hypothetical protein WKF43_09130 [Acidimicrobiales bacterium]
MLAPVVLALGLAAPASAVQFPQATVVSANPINTSPHVLDGKVLSIVEVGSTVVVGGQFTRVRTASDTTEVARVNLFSYNRVTGAIDAGFVPTLNGVVNTLAVGPEGTTVIVGGAFTNVNGATINRLAKLRLSDGTAVTTFAAGATAVVHDIARRGNTLYVGGAFLKIKGVSRGLLAAIDATTGKVSAELNLPVSMGIRNAAAVKKLDVTPNGDRLAIVGNFQQVAGVSKSQMAMIDLASSPDTLADWHTNGFNPRCAGVFDTYLRDVDFSPNGTWLGIVTTGAGIPNTLCDTATRFETYISGTDIKPTWTNFSGGDTLYSVAITDAAVYIGGHQRWMNNRNGAGDQKLDGAVDRPGIAALDPLTGVPLRWNPTRTRGVGAFALLATAEGLYVGSDTTWLGKEYHGRLGYFPLAGGSSNAAPRSATLPTDLFTATADGSLDRRSFDGATLGAPATVGGPTLDGVNWADVRGAAMVNGVLYTALANGTLTSWTPSGSGFANPVNLNSWVSWAGVSSLSYSGGKLMYTVAGDSRLFSRWFSIESGIVGSEQFVADSGSAGAGWNSAVGATVVGATVYVAHTDGNLTRTDLANGVPVSGTTVSVSGPAVGDGQNWNVVDLFVHSN